MTPHLKNQLLSLCFTFTFLIVFVHQVHFWPIGTSLPVFAGFIFMNSLPAFLLTLFMYLAVVAVLAVPDQFAFLICLVWLLFLDFVHSWWSLFSLLRIIVVILIIALHFLSMIALLILELLSNCVVVAIRDMSSRVIVVWSFWTTTLCNSLGSAN